MPTLPEMAGASPAMTETHQPQGPLPTYVNGWGAWYDLRNFPARAGGCADGMRRCRCCAAPPAIVPVVSPRVRQARRIPRAGDDFKCAWAGSMLLVGWVNPVEFAQQGQPFKPGPLVGPGAGGAAPAPAVS